MAKTVLDAIVRIDRALPFVPAMEDGEPREALEAAREVLVRLQALMESKRALEIELEELKSQLVTIW